MALESLMYEVRWLDASFRMTPRKNEFTLGDFTCTIDGNQLIAVPGHTYVDEASARAALELHLRAWELQLELEHGHRAEFRLSGSMGKEVAADGTKHYQVGVNEYISIASSVSVDVRATLPAYVGGYRDGPLTSRYLPRLRDLRTGRNKVTQVAYAIVSDLTHTYGGLPQAASSLGVSRSLLVEVQKLRAAGTQPRAARPRAAASP